MCCCFVEVLLIITICYAGQGTILVLEKLVLLKSFSEAINLLLFTTIHSVFVTLKYFTHVHNHEKYVTAN